MEKLYIKALHIYGFGKHENKKLYFDKGLSVIYGGNEAGKTTIQQFILQIFYGFPTKKEEVRRYEPKVATQYGGKITIVHETYGECEIERVRGNAVEGDVTITLDNKTRKDASFLPQLLYGYSRASLAAIFAFSVEELQGMERLSEEELSRVLLASGTTDIEKLMAMAKQLTSQETQHSSHSVQAHLHKITELEQRSKQLHHALQSYDVEVQTLQEVERAITNLRQQKIEANQQWQYYRTLLQQLPLIIERSRIEETLAQAEVLPFVRHEMEEFIQTKAMILEDERKLHQLQQEKTQEQQALAFDIARFSATTDMLTHETPWHQNQQKIAMLQDEIEQIERENAKQFRLLGINTIEEQEVMLKQNVSIEKEEQFQQVLRQMKEIDAQLSLQLHTLNDVHKELEALEGTTDTEGIRIRRKEEREQRIKQMQFVKFFAAIAAILFLLMSWFWQNVYTFVAGVACILVFLYIVQLRLRMTSERFVEEQIENYKQRYHKIKEDISELEQQHDQQEILLQQFIQSFYTKPLTDRSLMKELFVRVRKLQEDAQIIAVKKERLQDSLMRQEQILQDVQQLLQNDVDVDQAFSLVHRLREQLQPQYEAYQQATKRIETIDKEVSRLTERLALQHQAQKDYFTKMQVVDEEMLYDAFAEWQLVEQRKERLQILQEQITIAPPTTVDDQEIIARTEHYLYEEQEIEKRLEEKITEQQQLQQTLRAKEQDESYGEVMQHYEQTKESFRQAVMDWAKTQTVITAIEQTFTQLRERKLPQVLTFASEYFHLLTQKQYAKLIVNEDGYFEVEATGGQRYRIVELSQATKQQAYTALRFALAKTLEKTAPLPFIMDDPFVHFDRNRFMYMVQLIRAISKDRQVIYFTCQSVDSWQKDEVQQL